MPRLSVIGALAHLRANVLCHHDVGGKTGKLVFAAAVWMCIRSHVCKGCLTLEAPIV